MSKFLGDKYKFYKEYLKQKLENKSDEKIMTLEEFYHDKELVREPIFEYNCLGLNDKPSGCPVCPICKEPTYSLKHCAFCGQRLEKECNLWESDEYTKENSCNNDEIKSEGVNLYELVDNNGLVSSVRCTDFQTAEGYFKTKFKGEYRIVCSEKLETKNIEL